MKDREYIEIKENILQHAMEQWGIKDPRQLDPVVDLLLDVFAYETSKLHQEIKKSDARILHRLSRILVDNKWSLPIPSHALMSINPAPNESCMLTPEDHFYTERNVFGKDNIQLFFTPLATHKLIDGSVFCWMYDTDITCIANKSSLNATVFNKKDKIGDFMLWLGILISDAQLQEINDLSLCLLVKNSSTLPFLSMMKVFDVDGNEMQVSPTLFTTNDIDIEETHYFKDIASYYEDFFYTVTLDEKSKKQKTLQEQFPLIHKENDDINTSNKLFWLRIQLPEVFDKEQLSELQILINTYPVVNRQLIYKQHDFSTNGKIMPFPNKKDSYFLNIYSVQDNRGNIYKNVIKCNEEDLSGTFSLYFGDIERFNPDSARAIIAKVLQLIKEDGNAFAAMNPDAITVHLKDLLSRLDELEKNIDSVTKEDVKERTFLLTAPMQEATHYEIKYWLTNGAWANGLDERAFIQQFNSEKFNTAGIKFRTETQGGKVRKDEHELINSLRYGLLTKERIVSREDIKSFIKQQLGAYVNSIEIRDGLAISNELKKGIIRTTEIVIKLVPSISEKMIDLPVLAHFLEKELSEKSVSNTPYKIRFQ